MNMPGFAAEQSLKRQWGTYLQHVTSRSGERAGEVRPQLPPAGDMWCNWIFKCCYNGNVACCWYYVWKC
jgi:hypothetical protein